MAKENIIDLELIRSNTERNVNPPKKVTPMSKELEAAIQNLIDRLRESDPIKQSG